MTPYKISEYHDFSAGTPAHTAQREAIESVRARFGNEYPNFINGKHSITEKKSVSINPAAPSEIIGYFQQATQADAETAMQAALTAFESWKKVPAQQRAEYLFKAAEIVRQRRFEINAWMISEVGKNYLEADADTCEAIDFLEFYGREALRYAEPQPVESIPGEKTSYFYIPLGVGFVIPPWNFPFAILVGTAAAAIVSGNTVILKPSGESPMMGWLFADIMHQVGLPAGVLNFLVGSSSEIGDYLVEHKSTRFISFTGSMQVGLHINEKAAKTVPGQIWIKRVVAEMGGKDAIIVDANCNLDEAAKGVAASAFGFQGQKCSACSRAIVDASIYDEFIAKLKSEVEAIEQGNPIDNFRSGPVVSRSAYNKILEYIEIGKSEGTLLCGGEKGSEEGFYIKPTVIINVDRNARIAQEEIFGPVLAVIKSANFDDALEIANGTMFGLTGAIYTNDQDKLERARHEFHVGNLYLNRKCTGALVGAHPFGGFNMSGTDSKAGSRDYLMLFMQGKSVAEKPLA